MNRDLVMHQDVIKDNLVERIVPQVNQRDKQVQTNIAEAVIVLEILATETIGQIVDTEVEIVPDSPGLVRIDKLTIKKNGNVKFPLR